MNSIVYRVEVLEGNTVLEHSELFSHRKRAEQEREYFENLYKRDIEDDAVTIKLTTSFVNDEGED